MEWSDGVSLGGFLVTISRRVISVQVKGAYLRGIDVLLNDLRISVLIII